jgi:putative ABC transport system substrate-binding protein
VDRRLFLSILALGLLTVPLAAEAQRAARVPRIGLLMGGTPASTAPLIEPFRQGLRELGYVEGQNIAFEFRYAEWNSEVLPGLAAELVRLKVNAIFVVTAPAIRAVKQATNTIPIVMAAVADPVEVDFVASLARPGGNITGVSALAVGYSAKWLELLKEAVPKISRVAVLLNPANPSHAGYWRELQVAGRALGVTPQSVEVRGPDEFAGAFGAMTKGRAGGLIVPPDALIFAHRARIVGLAAKNRLPAMYGLRELVEAGGLMAYSSSLHDLFRRAATFVDKILKGARPADLPVEQVTRVELVINLKTAKALGLTIPQSILIRADEVIQ